MISVGFNYLRIFLSIWNGKIVKDRFPLMFLIVSTVFSFSNRVVVCLFVYIVSISFSLFIVVSSLLYCLIQLAWWKLLLRRDVHLLLLAILSLLLCTVQKSRVMQLIVFASIPFQKAFTLFQHVVSCDCHFIVVIIIKRNCLNFFVNHFQYVFQFQYFFFFFISLSMFESFRLCVFGISFIFYGHMKLLE